MLTLGQALEQRGAAGVPLPTAYASLAHAGADICRGALTLIVGPPSAGKTLLIFNMIVRMPGVSVLAFLLDTSRLTASGRFASIITGEDYRDIKTAVIDGGQGERYRAELDRSLPDVRVVFKAPTLEDVSRHIAAYEQRFGLPPDLVVIDNLGNQSTQFENEYQVLKAMTLELADLARQEECAIIGAHHTTEWMSPEPAPRDKVLGKTGQYPEVILSVGFNGETSEYKIAVVKNREGVTDIRAERPVVLYADPAKMQLTEGLKPVPSFKPELVKDGHDDSSGLSPALPAAAASGGGFGGF